MASLRRGLPGEGAPDLTKLRDLPRAEAIRIAMIRYGWDGAAAAMRVDIEQGRYPEESAGGNKRQGPHTAEEHNPPAAGTQE